MKHKMIELTISEAVAIRDYIRQSLLIVTNDGLMMEVDMLSELMSAYKKCKEGEGVYFIEDIINRENMVKTQG